MIDQSTAYVLDLAQSLILDQVGGKAVNLGRMIQVGFPVPGGFAVTTAAYRQSRGPISANGACQPAPEVAAAILDAYARMGRPMVAVRSSATAEDREDASMAGQYETILNVQGDQALLEAVAACWASLDSERTRAYLARHGLSPETVAMGVAVQRQVAAETAGVLFTTNPRTGGMDQALIEASWGLGESVVSGKVQPDTMILDQATGKVLDVTIGSKSTWLKPGSREELPTPPEKQSAPCLQARQVLELWQLGKRIANHFRAPQDIEWAFANDRLYLLQTRAITTLEEIEAQENALTDVRHRLRTAAQNGRGPWVRHNLDETMAHPSPLAWNVISHFMSGAGGFGNLYREVGFEPAKEVCEHGFLDVLAGRIYMDLSRSAELFYPDFPYSYDLRKLRDNPGAAQEPPSIPRRSGAARYRVGKRLQEVSEKLDALAADFDHKFDQQFAPPFVAWVKQEKERDLTALTTKEWRELWEERRRKVLDQFAPKSLLPTLILTQAIQNLQGLLAEHFWNEPTEALLQKLAAGGIPDSTVRSAEMLFQAAAAEDDYMFQAWIAEFGHRAPREFDLAVPRWRERPEQVKAMAENLKGDISPMQRHRRQAETSSAKLEELCQALTAELAEELKYALELVHRYQRFREDGKHFLMLGYDLLRDLILEAQRRLEIDNACLLEFDELHDALATGFAPLHLLEKRQVEYRALEKIILPTLITEEDLAGLGESPVIDTGADQYRGLPVSGGRAKGPVRIVLSPDQAGNLGKDYVLACPSTDPNWTPLFANASALVLECGGSLSHGAVVAREMGVPAVVLPDATQILHQDEIVEVNGDHGRVCRDTPDATTAQADAEDDEQQPIPCELLPPPPGRREQWAARLRNRFVLIWAIFFAAIYGLPENWLYQPVFGLVDRVLLPLAAATSWPAAVIIPAVFFAAICMIGQRLLTDNTRLLEAKRRAALLQKQARQMPADSVRRKRMMQLSGGVQVRTLLASFVPLAVVFGPMLLTFLWFPQRVDAIWHNAEPGTTAFVRALVDGDFTQPVRLQVDPRLEIDTSTEAAQSNPPIRATLQNLRRQWQRSPLPDEATVSWDLQAATIWAREQMLADLDAYLANPIAPRWIAWTVFTPVDEGGRFPIAAEAGDDNEVLRTHLVLGTRHRPEPREIDDPQRPVLQKVTARTAGPLRELEVAYRRQLTYDDIHYFWRPFMFLGIGWNFGWLMTYLAVYLPAMFLSRWALRVA